MFGRDLAGTLFIHLYIFGRDCPLTEFCQVQNSLCLPSLAFSYIGSVTPRHSSSGRQPNFVAWYKEWNYGTFADGAAYIRLGGHHVGHRPTFYFCVISPNSVASWAQCIQEGQHPLTGQRAANFRLLANQ